MPMLIFTSFKYAVPFIVYHRQDAMLQSQEHQKPNPKHQVRKLVTGHNYLVTKPYMLISVHVIHKACEVNMTLERLGLHIISSAVTQM